jgi:hypothetical protein
MEILQRYPGKKFDANFLAFGAFMEIMENGGIHSPWIQTYTKIQWESLLQRMDAIYCELGAFQVYSSFIFYNLFF